MRDVQEQGSGLIARQALRAVEWVDARTGVKSLVRKALHEPIPGGARIAYVFGSGLLCIFLLQVVTGVSLALYYTPTAETAHTSVAYISKQVAGGAFLRSLHSYGSSAMIIVLGLHFMQTFFYGSFKGRRELLWMSGALLSFLILGMGFTGYLLPWDQKAYFATAVGTNVAGQVPIIGSLITRMLRGGDTIGTLTISRFYVAHVFLIPATILLFIGAHIFLFRKAGPAGPVDEDPIAPKMPVECFYPRQVIFDMVFALLVVAVLAGLSYLRPVTLGPMANPSDPHFLPRPEWYYLPMFEWLKFWEGPAVVIGVVVLPGLVATAFFLMPFLDRKFERRPWRRPIPALAVSVVVLGMVYLGLKSQIDDHRGPVAEQLAQQQQEEREYFAAPFEPYTEGVEGNSVTAAMASVSDPLIARGKGMYIERGCTGCHGANGKGTAMAPSLVGVLRRYPEQQLIGLLRDRTAKMKSAGMPAVDAPQAEMAALVAYLGAFGTPGAGVTPVFAKSQRNETMLSNTTAAGSSGANLVRVSANPGGGGDSLTGMPAVAAGKQAFQQRGCFACHGQEGAGGLAPALAPLVAKLSTGDLLQVLRAPNARMQQGGMQPVEGTPEEIQSLVSYLKSLRPPGARKSPTAASAEAIPAVASQSAGTAEVKAPEAAQSTTSIASNGKSSSADPAVSGRAIFMTQGCVACHGVNGKGTPVGPSLVGVGTRYPGDSLSNLLRHPTPKMQAGGMPTPSVNDVQMLQLVSYLSSLNTTPVSHTTAPAATAEAEVHESPGTPAAAATPHAEKAPAAESRAISSDPVVLRGQVVFRRNACGTCHGPDGLHGTAAAPALAGTASLLPSATIEHLLRHHSERMQQGGMPPTSFSQRDLAAIVAYIRSLPSEAAELRSRR